MLTLDVDNVLEYLRSSRRIDSGPGYRVELLSGGVSNLVLRIDRGGRDGLVVKQSRERLRTVAAWYSRLDRIWREAAVMSTLAPRLPSGAVPRIRFEDRENYVLGMEAVDSQHTVWKQDLLEGRLQPEIAARLGDYLAMIHGKTCADPAVAREFDDREIFVQLRVDPFYRRVADVHHDLRPAVEDLIAEMWQTRACLVHADFSPKNVLVVQPPGPAAGAPPQLTLIDFETGHYGDPAFDLGFFLSHLLLKGVRVGAGLPRFVRLAATFWERYAAGIAARGWDGALEKSGLERRTVANLAGCALARVDGTSPVDYLDDPSRDVVRCYCRRLFLERVERVDAAFSVLAEVLGGAAA